MCTHKQIWQPEFCYSFQLPEETMCNFSEEKLQLHDALLALKIKINALKKICNPALAMCLLQEISMVCFQGIGMERAGNEKLNVWEGSV